MRIDKALNLVIPVTRGDGAQIFVHSTPIAADIFDTFFLPIAKTFSSIYAEGLGAIGGPRIADKMLRKVAKDLQVWDGPAGVEQGLVNEMRRLTNVLVPGTKGWEMLPFFEACKNGNLDASDASEVEAAVTFFTVISCMHRRATREKILDGAMTLWGARIESLDCSEFLRSLLMSMPAANTGVKAA